MKTLIEVFLVPRSFSQDELTLSSGGTNVTKIQHDVLNLIENKLSLM